MTAPAETSTDAEAQGRFVQYLLLKVDAAWRRQDDASRARGRSELIESLGRADGMTVHAYSTVGLKAGAELLLWISAASAEAAQHAIACAMRSGMGRWCEITHALWGLTRPSLYTKKRTSQEHALDEPRRLKYLVVYPFVKTVEWYMMSREARQGMMNEHMRVGHEFDDVRQVLVYTTGLDDQEFIVAYETDRLERHQDLVIALRSTEARRYTQRDTPIYTAIHHSLEDALGLAG
jgi:chlorite dismutase